MYVVVLFNKYDESVDCVIGPFDDLPAAQAWTRDHSGREYRHLSTQKLRMELPEWAT